MARGVRPPPCYPAGLRLPDEAVRELAKLVDEPTHSFLEKSLALETGVVALTIDDRERIGGRSTMPVRMRLQSFAGCCSQNTKQASATDSSSSDESLPVCLC